MELKDLFVGQRVYSQHHGEGRVLQVDQEPDLVLPVLVEWDISRRSYHDGGGRGRPQHCYWMSNQGLEEVFSESVVEISLSLDSVLNGE